MAVTQRYLGQQSDALQTLEQLNAVAPNHARSFQEAGHNYKKLGDLAFVDVTGRIAHAIMDLCNEPDALTHPDGMQIKVSRQELSRLVGCSREMAGRVLKVLEEQGLVSASGKTIVVYGARPNRNL